jgi:hypothetical protein
MAVAQLAIEGYAKPSVGTEVRNNLIQSISRGPEE